MGIYPQKKLTIRSIRKDKTVEKSICCTKGIKIKLSFSKLAEHHGILIKGVLEHVLLINLSKTSKNNYTDIF